METEIPVNEKETSFRRRVYTTIETLIDIENTDQLQEHVRLFK